MTFEVVIIDDGSTDATFKKLQELANQDSRITLLSQENSGVASARNKGISIAKGTYLLFVDSDDHLEPKFVETYDDLLRVYPEALIYQSFISRYHDKTVSEMLPNHLYTKEQISDCLIVLEKNRCLGGACNKIFNVKIINDFNIRFNEELQYGEDKIFTLEYMQYIEEIFLSGTCYYIYNRVTENSLSKKHHPSKNLLLLAELEYALFRSWLKRFPNEKLGSIINARYSSFSKYALLSMYRRGDSANTKDRKILRKKIIEFDKNHEINTEFEIEVPPLINWIYKYELLMRIAMSLRTTFSSTYNFLRNNG